MPTHRLVRPTGGRRPGFDVERIRPAIRPVATIACAALAGAMLASCSPDRAAPEPGDATAEVGVFTPSGPAPRAGSGLDGTTYADHADALGEDARGVSYSPWVPPWVVTNRSTRAIRFKIFPAEWGRFGLALNRNSTQIPYIHLEPGEMFTFRPGQHLIGSEAEVHLLVQVVNPRWSEASVERYQLYGSHPMSITLMLDEETAADPSVLVAVADETGPGRAEPVPRRVWPSATGE